MKDKELWIVAIDEPYYPTIYVFEKREDAEKLYKEEGGDLVYLAKVVRKKQGTKDALKDALKNGSELRKSKE